MVVELAVVNRPVSAIGPWDAEDCHLACLRRLGSYPPVTGHAIEKHRCVVSSVVVCHPWIAILVCRRAIVPS